LVGTQKASSSFRTSNEIVAALETLVRNAAEH
jgi:hypothetical protein